MTQANTISLDYYVTKAGTIPRLTNSKFTIWSNAVKYALIGSDAWNIVDGSEEAPDVNGFQRTRDKHRKYVKRSNKAVSILYGSITPAVQSYVRGIVDSAQMWTTICNTMDIVQNESSSN